MWHGYGYEKTILCILYLGYDYPGIGNPFMKNFPEKIPVQENFWEKYGTFFSARKRS
jgi:hypothetical protein